MNYKYSLPSNGNKSSTLIGMNSTTFLYPCIDSNNNCGPITLDLLPGKYFIENWGASGGEPYGGGGGYTSGMIWVSKSSRFYLYIGRQGHFGSQTIPQFVFNGGGNGGSARGASGGGATDVRLEISETKNWDDFQSLKSRLMVAGGGGGGEYNEMHAHSLGYGGSGGGLIGFDGSDRSDISGGTPITSASGGSQTQPGRIGSTSEGDLYCMSTDGGFGYGGRITTGGSCTYPGVHGGGGGGGFYGGGSGVTANMHVGTGAGGSSYISGHPDCKAINPLSTSASISHLTHSNHSSGIIFTNPRIIDGNSKMPSPLGFGLFENKGHFGNGAIRISTTLTSRFSRVLPKRKIVNLFLFISAIIFISVG